MLQFNYVSHEKYFLLFVLNQLPGNFILFHLVFVLWETVNSYSLFTLSMPFTVSTYSLQFPHIYLFSILKNLSLFNFSPCGNIPNPQLYLFSDFTVFLSGRIAVPYFHLILYCFHNSSCYSIFCFDHSEHWKDVFRELSIRSTSRIIFLMVIWNLVLCLSTYALFPFTMIGKNLHSWRTNFICPSTMQIFCIIRPFCNLYLSVPVLTLIIHFVLFGDFLPHYLPLNHII